MTLSAAPARCFTSRCRTSRRSTASTSSGLSTPRRSSSAVSASCRSASTYSSDPPVAGSRDRTRSAAAHSPTSDRAVPASASRPPTTSDPASRQAVLAARDTIARRGRSPRGRRPGTTPGASARCPTVHLVDHTDTRPPVERSPTRARSLRPSHLPQDRPPAAPGPRDAAPASARDTPSRSIASAPRECRPCPRASPGPRRSSYLGQQVSRRPRHRASRWRDRVRERVEQARLARVRRAGDHDQGAVVQPLARGGRPEQTLARRGRHSIRRPAPPAR